MADKAFERVRNAEVQSYLREFTDRTAELTRAKDQTGLYQHIKYLELEGRSSTFIKNAAGVLLRDTPSILLRWKTWFQTLLNAKSRRLDPSIIDGIEQLPEYAPIADEPTMEEVAMGQLEMARRLVLTTSAANH